MGNRYYEEYRGKVRTPEQIVGMIRDDAYISFGQFAGNPTGLLSCVHQIKGRAKNVTLQSSSVMQDYPFMQDPELKAFLSYETWFYGPYERREHHNGMVSFMPGGLALCAAKKLSHRKPTMFWGMSSPMDAHGNFNLGLSIAYEMEMLEAADVVVIEVNENAPRVFGDNTVSIKDVDYVVEHACPVPTITPSSITEVEDRIGAYAASLVHNGDVIQLGIGNIPDAVGMHFQDKRDLSVHTELITDSMAKLYEQGVITNKTKRLWKDKMVGTLILGSQFLYDFVNDNPAVALKRGSEINNPYIIAQNDNQCSINTALSVDLTGAVSSESIGHRQFSATGGQFETAYGAQFSKGGRSIIALRSTAKKGSVSTIVSAFVPGTATTLDRNNVDYVVTEYGIAALRGRTIRERVRALIEIANPKFRAELEKEADEQNIW